MNMTNTHTYTHTRPMRRRIDTCSPRDEIIYIHREENFLHVSLLTKNCLDDEDDDKNTTG
jgi:hypothetical protein